MNWRERINAVLNGSGPTIVFQPIFTLGTQASDDAVAGYEALARFDGLGEATIGPDVWFAQATLAGLGVDLEMKAVAGALAHLDEIAEPLYMSVNVSPAAVVSDGFVAALTGGILGSGAVPHHRVVLELTEHDEVADYEPLKQVMADLRMAGYLFCNPVGKRFPENYVKLAIDDVGAGFASMRHILALSPDMMKLDVSLIRDLDTDRPRLALAAAMVSFGAKLGIKVVAEGVETSAELDVLRYLGVHAVQGYLMGRPGPLPLKPPLSLPA